MRRVLVIEHEADAGLGLFDGWLADAGVDRHVVRPYLGEAVPRTVDEGLIVLGGEASAWDDDAYPWLPATRDLLRAAVAAGVPTLGICLGAQLMTLACGGRVEQGAHGVEVGLGQVIPLPEAADDLLLGSLTAAVPAIQFHQDALTGLPPGAVPLATGDPYPNQAYRLGERAWAVQFHPEADARTFDSWVFAAEAAYGFDAQRLSTQVKEWEPTLAATWRSLAASFASL